jgi:glucosyl-3-phosphoglycerate synthase
VADFHQTDTIATLHRLQPERLRTWEADLERYARHRGVSLILPALITEFERPAMHRICEHLREARYFSNIVVAIGRATREQVEEASAFFDGFRSRVTILWVEDPSIQEVFASLEREGLPAKRDGKGRTCWLSMGYLLAEGESDVIALHDCDIVNYTREIPAALCYPLAHPHLDFAFCKGYYARFSEKLHGRVTRLFLAPLLQALRDVVPASTFLSFLSEFRYPLAGEFAMTADVARRLHLPADWGLEIGVLSEVLQHAGAERVCQSDIADNYDHKHQDLSASDPSKGLRRMSFDIASALIRCLRDRDTALTSSELSRVSERYLKCAGAKLRQYEADALMNHLRYDRREEAVAIGTFAQSLYEAIAVRESAVAETLPSWSTIEARAPHVMRNLLDCVFTGPAPVQTPVSNWFRTVPEAVFSAPAS